ncbi:MAG: hypothetical protein KUL77_02895 [Thermomonas sp.]|uniref:PepSY domain-containing protein n=1 Tax=Thermomonas sp. TaxID=1971895 RepID=UPI001EC2CBA5|nr:hypothetical protein [Thermomonas sp.]MBV2208494.1 hypothetical protein [Thermomonas sp.]
MLKVLHVRSKLFAFILPAALLSAPALAQQQPPPPPPQQREAPPPRMAGSLSDSVRRAERNTRGEVLSAERVQYDGRDMHRVKVVDNNGRVRVFMQDPARGAPRPPQRDNDD